MRNGKMEMESNLESADRLYVWFTLSLPYEFWSIWFFRIYNQYTFSSPALVR